MSSGSNDASFDVRILENGAIVFVEKNECLHIIYITIASIIK